MCRQLSPQSPSFAQLDSPAIEQFAAFARALLARLSFTLKL
jgi:hypothetical protein